MATYEMTKYKAEQLLGLSGEYSYKELNSAYRQAVKENHPDAGGSSEKMIEINSAKSYLDTYFATDRSARVAASSSEQHGAGDTGDSATVPETETHTTCTASANPAADTIHETGPYAERTRAKKADGRAWQKKSFAYANRSNGKVHTAKGDIESNEPGWRTNAGVPFAYAAVDDYDLWQEINIAAETEAAYRNKVYGGTTFSAAEGFTGAMWLNPEDRATVLGWNEKKDETNGNKTSAAGGFHIDMEEPVRPEDRFDSRISGSYYKRNDIENAPKGWRMANKVANRFPYRILFLVLAFAFLSILPELGLYDSTTTWIRIAVLFAIVLNTPFGIITNRIRGLIRFGLDEWLKSWARKNDVQIDWKAALDV